MEPSPPRPPLGWLSPLRGSPSSQRPLPQLRRPPLLGSAPPPHPPLAWPGWPLPPLSPSFFSGMAPLHLASTSFSSSPPPVPPSPSTTSPSEGLLEAVVEQTPPTPSLPTLLAEGESSPSPLAEEVGRLGPLRISEPSVALPDPPPPAPSS
ncbi:hypothetical protein LOK49_LG11G00472 [Camellia lanceoleosa]|uniref:Uncharacterized protein n=1 Tax=Camellia lanceoleosa TaxID=1840588 RepID=A0ACC0G2X5_9ERIC|nr:hypothetical protein LOK49_LG11G00472 [Camellia lanceoleosa]